MSLDKKKTVSIETSLNEMVKRTTACEPKIYNCKVNETISFTFDATDISNCFYN